MNKDWLDIDVLEDYLDGKLDGKAMHFVEKQALEDPFIAEALEGLRQAPKRKQNFSILQKKLYERIAQKPIKRKLWSTTTQRLSVAATATVVFIAVSILFFMRENNRKNTEITQRRAKGVVVNMDSNVAVVTIKPEIKNTPSTILSEKSALIDKAIADAKKDNLAVYAKKIPSTKIVSDMARPVAVSEEIVAKREKALMQVQSAKNAIVAQTDVYAVKNVDSAKKIVGYAKDQALTEVIIASAKKKQIESSVKVASKRRAAVADKVMPTVNKPRPAMLDYDKYLATNNKLLNKTATTGKVLLSFNINKSGRPENIKIVKSLSKEADAEAIRLVKEGPSWLLTSEAENYVDLEVKF